VTAAGRGAGTPHPAAERRRRSAAVLLATALALLVAAALVPPAGASGDRAGGRQPSTGIVVERVAPWVEPDGDWTVDLGGMEAVPPGTTVSYTIHRQLSGTAAAIHSRIEKILDGANPGAGLQNEVRATLLGPPADGRYRILVPIRPRSGDPARLLLPNSGVHPVTIEVRGPDGSELFDGTVFLNRLPDVKGRAPLLISTTLGVSGPPAFDARGDALVDGETIERVEQRSAILDEAEFPVSVALDPSLTEAMSRSPEAQTAYDRLVEAVSRHVLMRRTWVPVDVTRWSTTAARGEITAQLSAGQASLAAGAGSVGDISTWGLDPTLSSTAVPVLRANAFDRALIIDSQLTERSRRDLPTERLRTLTVRDAGSTITALSVDAVAQALLGAEPQDRDSDALRVNAAVSSLLATWAAEPGEDVSGALIAFDAMPAPRAKVLASVLSEPETPLVRVVDVGTVFEQVQPLTRRRGRSTEPVEVSLRPGETSVDDATLSRLGGVRNALDGYLSMMEEAVDVSDAPLQERVLLSEHRDLQPGAAAAVLAGIEQRIGADLAQITGPTARSITLTARQATIPVRIENGLDRPVRARVRLDSNRVQVRGGNNRVVELEPGTNRLNLPVTVRTSGQFSVDVTVLSADGAIPISHARIRVRSQVFSGVGIALGAGALVFLVVWWFTTYRRERRSEAHDVAG
jgi:hypothetical protein